MGIGSSGFNRFSMGGASTQSPWVIGPNGTYQRADELAPARSFGGFGYQSGPGGMGVPGADWGAAAGIAGQGAPGQGFGKQALDWLLKNPDVALAGVSMVSNARKNAKADKLRKQALKIQQERAEETAGLRRKMIADLSGEEVVAPRVSLRDRSNPYSR